MNRLDLLAATYARLHNYKGVPYWVLTPLRKMVRAVANKVLPSYLSKAPKTAGKQKTSDVIVSLTSFPARIDNVWQVIECLLRQTCRPKKILLWLSRDQFPTADSIPESLRNRTGDVFEIRMVDGDIRSHKKYYYVAKEYPDSLVFIIDDDIYYPSTLLARTLECHLKHPDSVICNYGYWMKYNSAGRVQSYRSWEECLVDSEEEDLFFGSGGGTLIVPSRMDKHLTDIELSLKLTPIADDIWLNTMTRLAGLKIVMLSHGLILPVKQKENISLASQNIGESKNDVQIQNIEGFFGPVFSHNN